MADSMDIITKAFGRYLTGFSTSEAILEDYAKVVSRLENLTEEEVKNRIRKRSKEIFEKIKEEQLKETEALQKTAEETDQ